MKKYFKILLHILVLFCTTFFQDAASAGNPNLVVVKEGETAEIVCEVPNANTTETMEIFWKKNHIKLTGDGAEDAPERYTFDNQPSTDGVSYRISISSTTKEDGGVFKCMSDDNDVTLPVKIFNLTVEPADNHVTKEKAPDNEKNGRKGTGVQDVSSEAVFEGELAEIECETSDAIPTVLWMKDGNIIVPGKMPETYTLDDIPVPETKSMFHRLTISSTKKEDDGVFKCFAFADNAPPTVVKEVTLIVKVAEETHDEGDESHKGTTAANEGTEGNEATTEAMGKIPADTSEKAPANVTEKVPGNPTNGNDDVKDKVEQPKGASGTSSQPSSSSLSATTMFYTFLALAGLVLIAYVIHSYKPQIMSCIKDSSSTRRKSDDRPDTKHYSRVPSNVADSFSADDVREPRKKAREHIY